MLLLWGIFFLPTKAAARNVAAGGTTGQAYCASAQYRYYCKYVFMFQYRYLCLRL